MYKRQILVIFVLAGAAGAAYYYIKFVKGRKPKDATEPSRLIESSFCASTANSIGSLASTSRAVSYTHLDGYKRQGCRGDFDGTHGLGHRLAPGASAQEKDYD